MLFPQAFKKIVDFCFYAANASIYGLRDCHKLTTFLDQLLHGSDVLMALHNYDPPALVGFCNNYFLVHGQIVHEFCITTGNYSRKNFTRLESMIELTTDGF